MNKLFVRNFFIGLICSGFVILAVYKFVINKPHKDVTEEKALTISAAQLFNEFSANEQEANKKYLNRAIEVQGTVADMDKNQDGGQFIVLQTDDPMSGVMCTMREPANESIRGTHVAVKGFCSGFVGDVKLTDCVMSR